MSAAASGYEYDRGEPDDLVRRSVAVATAEVIDVTEPERPAIEGEMPNDETAALAFVNDVLVPVSVRIDEVLAGTAVEPGREYVLGVSAWVRDEVLYEFEEDRLPLPGERYLLLLTFNRLQDAPELSGYLRTTAAGDGRVPLDEAAAAGMTSPDRWRGALAADFPSAYAEELRSEGFLP
jgi:hypothetical protein